MAKADGGASVLGPSSSGLTSFPVAGVPWLSAPSTGHFSRESCFSETSASNRMADIYATLGRVAARGLDLPVSAWGQFEFHEGHQPHLASKQHLSFSNFSLLLLPSSFIEVSTPAASPGVKGQAFTGVSLWRRASPLRTGGALESPGPAGLVPGAPIANQRWYQTLRTQSPLCTPQTWKS